MILKNKVCTVDTIIANGMNFSVLFNPARTRVGGYLDTLKKESGGYYGTNLGDFYTKAVQHIYDNTGKSTGEVEPDPDEPEDPDPLMGTCPTNLWNAHEDLLAGEIIPQELGISYQSHDKQNPFLSILLGPLYNAYWFFYSSVW